jgi:hypothetical protein
MMKQIFLILTIILLSGTTIAQVGVNTANPDTSAVLDISSNDKGVLFPRMDLGDLTVADPVVNPVESLLVWNTDAANGGSAKGFYYWDGEWKAFGTSSSDQLSGVFGELTLDSDLNTSLRRYNNTFITSSSTGTSSGVTLNSAQSTMTVQVDGRYRLTYTITYDKVYNAGSNYIEFYLHRYNTPIDASKTTGNLSTSQNTVTHTVELDLNANQTYGMGISRSDTGPGDIDITIYSDLTQFSLQRL